MQATVRSYDPLTGGTVLLDDGVELPYDAATVRSAGLLMLRIGQRVRIAVDEGPSRVTSLTLSTF